MVELIVQEVNGEARVSSKVIAENVNLTHESVSRLIKKHIYHLEEFGRVGFEIVPLKTKGGIQSANIYNLNEDQSTLLLTCMKNTGIVMEFKKGLVKAFSSLKQQHLQQTVSNSIGIKEEFEIMQMTANFLNMNDSSKLEMTHKFYEIKGLDFKLLPDYSTSKGVVLSLSELLKRNSIELSAVAVNKLLVADGFLEIKERPSSTKGTKSFKALTEKGLKYGENLVSPHNKKEVAPQYYVDSFVELMGLIGVR